MNEPDTMAATRPCLTHREVLRVMRTLPRARFVPAEYAHEAGADHPLPIGCGQTISQPSLVAFMTARERFHVAAGLVARLIRETDAMATRPGASPALNEGTSSV